MLSALSPYLVGCLPGGAWTQVFTLHRRKHQALNYPNRGSRITCGHTPEGLVPIKRAQPGDVSNHLHKFSSPRPWESTWLQARTCGWAATELWIPLTVRCAQGWSCLWSWWVNSCRSGYSHQGRVPKLLQCSCDPRPACMFAAIDTGEHYPCCSNTPTLSLFFPFVFGENSVFFSWDFFFFFFF